MSLPDSTGISLCPSKAGVKSCPGPRSPFFVIPVSPFVVPSGGCSFSSVVDRVTMQGYTLQFFFSFGLSDGLVVLTSRL